MRWFCLPAGLLLALAAPAFAQRELKDIPSPDPELERQTFVVPEGFEVNLFAGDPQIAKPIQINFDADGRLWIASSSIYPQVEPGQAANDKILVLEDTDGDGVADSTTVFADQLLIPSAVVPGDGGAYVGASTDLFFYRDVDGDGRADEKRFVLSGFGTEDTHHTIHTLRWGPEQLLYFKQSIYIHSHLETPWGVKRLNAGGTWQFRPENLKLEVFDRGLVNSWGMAWDDYGATFATDGAGGEGINYIVPGASYFTAQGADRILSGLNPGSPKHCSLEVVGGPGLPEDWQGSLITNDFRGHRVCRFVLREVGSGFLSQEQQEVIKSNHVAFRPVDVKQGPDGALYIADWYNPIIQHGEVDFRDPRRDHVHGRIWRVSWKGGQADPSRKPETRLAERSTGELLGMLTSRDRFARQSAKRVLKERGAEQVLAELGRWAGSLDSADPLYPLWRLEALWMHQAFDVPNWELLESIVRCDDHRARAGAVRVLGDWLDRAETDIQDPAAFTGAASASAAGRANPAELLEIAIADPHPRVRLEAVRVLGRVEHPRAIEAATRVLEQDMDEFLDYALWLTSRELQPIWQPALSEGRIDFGGNARRLAFACKAAGSQAAVPSLIALLTAGQVEASDLRGVLDVIGEFGSPADLRTLLESAAEPSANPEYAADVERALLAAHRRRQAVPETPANALGFLIAAESPAIRGRAAELAGRYGVTTLLPVVLELAKYEDETISSGAIAGLEAYNDEEAFAALEQLAETPTGWASATIALLAQRPDQATAAFLRRLGADDELAAGSAGAAALTRVTQAFLQRKDGPQQLAAALSGQSISADRAKAALRVVASSGQAQDELTAAIRAAAQLDDQPQKLTEDQVRQLLADVSEHGDAARGEDVFRREELTCFKCHAIGDSGGIVGPNLVSLGASAQPDYILESLVEPNAKVKENYHTVIVATTDGEIITGIKVRETGQSLIVRDAEDRELSVPLDQIEEQSPGASIMPAGLVEKLTQQELVDLVAFLSSLGRAPEFSIGQSQIARRWEVLGATSEAAHQFHRLGLQEATRDNGAFQWTRAYSRVNGELPVAPLPDMRMLGQSRGDRGLSFVRCELEAAADGAAMLSLECPDDTRMWLNGEPLEPGASLPVTLTAGTHRITLAINQLSEARPLRLSIVDPGTAAARFVGGK
ncbi:MAG: c-type cytochrome [Planctomyces sp.]|nr:c-type cytochrome [Planctomyces sp.]